MNSKKWTNEEIEFMNKFYSKNGLDYCSKSLNRSKASVRQKASNLCLKQDMGSDFFNDWQSRAAQSKIGVKRPEHSKHMKELIASGKLSMPEITEDRRNAQSALMKNYIKENGHPRGAKGIRHSDETKRKISDSSKNMWLRLTDSQVEEIKKKMMETKEKNGTVAPERNGCTWKSGWREIGGYKKYYRSRWEANYARYLEHLRINGFIKSWLHEPKTFWFCGIKRGCVSYLPDFEVIENNGDFVYHEVKGWFDDRSKTKIKRMSKYYPKIKLIVVSSSEYKLLEKQVKNIIEGWE